MKLFVALVTLLYVSQHALGVQVHVYEGAESVLLPCQVTVSDPQFNAVLWSLERLTDQTVHIRDQSGDRLEKQNQKFISRTSMKTDALTTGDLSLTLRNPKISDSDTYTCIYNEGFDTKSRQQVHLKVTVHPGLIVGYVLAGVLAFLVFLVFFLVVVFILFLYWDGKTVKQVEEEGGESVQLPFRWTDTWWVKMRTCRICGDLPEDVRVEWTDQLYMKVHVYENGSVEQSLVYRGRTEMNEDLMKTGDFSLTLKDPTVRDTGYYTCSVYNRNKVLLRQRRVKLWVKGEQVEVEVEQGAESVQLPFKTTADLPEDVRVEWTDRDNIKVHVYENGSVGQDLVYRGRTEMKKDLMKTGDFSLILRHPTVRDRGEYYCRVYTKDGDLLLTRVDLKVKGQQVEVEQGAESVHLPFKTTGVLSEDVRVEWTDRDNRKVHVYENGSVGQDLVYRGRTVMNEDLMKTGDFRLTLNHLTVRDTGEYICSVYTKDGDLLTGTRVELKVKDKQVKVEEEQGAESVHLPFKTTGDLSEDVRVEWTDRDNMKVHVYENGSVGQSLVYRGRTVMNEDLKTGDFSLTLKDPTVRDTGEYTCRVYNKDGDLLTGTRVELKVKDRWVHVEEGAESVHLPFKTTGDLPEDVRVEWRDRDNMKVHVYNDRLGQDLKYRGRTEMKKDLMKTGDFSLTLRQPTERDRGSYTCRVYNKDGVILRQTRVAFSLTVKKKQSPAVKEAAEKLKVKKKQSPTGTDAASERAEETVCMIPIDQSDQC